MKKTLALVLAGVMAAGMTTVAFANLNDQTPVIGVDATSGNVQDDQITVFDHVFVLDDDGDAVATLDSVNDVLEGGDQLAIPIAIRTEADAENWGSYSWFSRNFDYKTSNVSVYADWDDVEGDVEGEVDTKWVKYTDDANFGDGNDYFYSVVITVPENDGDKLLDLVGKISVGRTRSAARNASNSVEVVATFGPDGEDSYYPSTTNFDGGVLDMGHTGIVSFDKEADVIDIEFGDDALFTVDVDGQSRLNLAWNVTFDREFAAKYDYANLDFLTFEGTPRFNRTGDFYIYADEDAFIYKKTADGAEKINGLEWDEDYEAWTFRTRELGAYVISDVELDEKTVTEDKDDTTDDGKVNPDTGR